MMGTVTPSSFLGQDLVPWIESRLESLGIGGDVFSSLGLGSVSVGRLRRGRQGPTALHSVQEEVVHVRVDRHGSHVGNPFCAAHISRLCMAYDELLRTVLTVPLKVDECLHDYEGLKQEAMPGMVLLTPFENKLLRTLADKHGVKIHRQRVRPLAVRAWLVYHASLLVKGVSLRLHCWCACGSLNLPPWSCHAQLLMGALLWLAHSWHADLLSSVVPSSQVMRFVLFFPVSFFLHLLSLLWEVVPCLSTPFYGK